VFLAEAQLAMFGLDAAESPVAVININSDQPFAFSKPVPGTGYDLIGGLEHELNEVLGGGGFGSNLNNIAPPCSGFFCDLVGGLDLYRYSAPGIPSFTTSSSASSYLSFDGGATELVAFNQDSRGDFGDFSPPGTGAGQLIQNAFDSMGEDEDYTTSSPEFAMMESLGYNGVSTVVPEPSTWAMMLLGLGGLGIARYRASPRARVS
jgi:hypothetical protein